MKDARAALKTEMEKTGLSLRDVSRALGLAPGLLSQWLNSRYRGNLTRIEENVKSFLKRCDERKRTPRREIKFMQTSVANQMFGIARLCHLEGEIGVATGPAGLGKTEAAKEYARLNPDTLLVEVDLGHTAKSLFSDLHRLIGHDGQGTVHDMFGGVVEKLKGSGRLIIVDEAEHLPYRALELVRRVYDKAAVGILLVGMPRLIANMRGKRGEYSQLYSRIGFAARLELLKPEDTKLLVTAFIPNANGLSEVFHETSHGNTRTLCKLVMRSLRLAQMSGTAVTPESIREAAGMLIF